MSQLISIVPTFIGSPQAISFGLVFIFLAVAVVALFAVLSAIFDMVLYAGGFALVIGSLFYFFDSLSLTAAWNYIAPILGLV